MKLYTLAFLTFSCTAQTPTQAVAVFMDFETKPSAQALALMQQETNALLAPAGILPAWHPRPLAASLSASFSKVLMVRFKGACMPGVPPASSIDDLQPFAPSSFRLAATRTQGKTVLPFAEVECDAVRRITSGVPRKDRVHALGQALGRVIAHELYHLLAQTQHHARGGLAQAVLPATDLLSATFDLEDLVLLAKTKGRE